jgi:dTDP-glucose 4,6-dehydratase
MTLRAVNQKTLPLYGDGQQKRTWLHAEDHAEALLKCLTHCKAGETYHISGDDELINKDVVCRICDILDNVYPLKNGASFRSLITTVEDRPGHDFRYSLNDSLTRTTLSWKPKIKFNIGLEQTVKWYVANKESWCVKALKDKYELERLGKG